MMLHKQVATPSPGGEDSCPGKKIEPRIIPTTDGIGKLFVMRVTGRFA